MQELYNAGLRGNLPLFIQNFLIDKKIKIKVRVRNNYSYLKAVQGNIPQGSVLSFTCFMIAINDTNNSLPPNIQSALYVDDYVIYASGSIPHMLERRLQTAINKLS